MISTDRPRQTPLQFHADEDGVVLHDPHTGSTHRLNGVARHLWELCDGSRDRAALALELAARFGIAADDVRGDVDAALAQFRDAGLIRTSGVSVRERTLLLEAVAAAIGSRSGQPPENVAAADWNALIHLAVDQGVLPLVHHCVATHWRDAVPSLVRERLHQQFAANAAVAEGFVAELLDLVRELNANDIVSLALRGPAMAHSLYGSAAFRQFGDLDIFIRPDTVERTCGILRRRGYEFSARRQTDALAIRTAAVGEITVDLQWALARRVFTFPLTLEELWDRSMTVDIGGVPVRQPGTSDYVLILCAHGSKHCWSSLIWITDIAAVLRVWGSHIDWPELLRRAASRGGEKQLLLGLRLAHDLLGAALPAPVEERMRSYALDHLIADVQQALFATATERSFQGSFGLIRGGIFYIKTRERLRDRAAHGVYLLRLSMVLALGMARPNHLDHAVVTLPAFLAFLYYPIRLVRVTLKWGAWLVRRVTSQRSPAPRRSGP
jgi:PqqD family protein of HPr-rel-A system